MQRLLHLWLIPYIVFPLTGGTYSMHKLSFLVASGRGCMWTVSGIMLWTSLKCENSMYLPLKVYNFDNILISTRNSYHFFTQCASSTTIATRCILYNSVDTIFFQTVVQKSALGLIKITWNIPAFICCRFSLDCTSLMYTVEIPNDCTDITCSSMRAISGDITMMIDEFSTLRR